MAKSSGSTEPSRANGPTQPLEPRRKNVPIATRGGSITTTTTARIQVSTEWCRRLAFATSWGTTSSQEARTPPSSRERESGSARLRRGGGGCGAEKASLQSADHRRTRPTRSIARRELRLHCLRRRSSEMTSRVVFMDTCPRQEQQADRAEE
jgi:hypothetical protein